MQKLVVTARIDGKTHRDLKDIAQRDDRSLSYLFRKAVEQYVSGASPQPTEGKGDRDGCRE